MSATNLSNSFAATSASAANNTAFLPPTSVSAVSARKESNAKSNASVNSVGKSVLVNRLVPTKLVTPKGRPVDLNNQITLGRGLSIFQGGPTRLQVRSTANGNDYPFRAPFIMSDGTFINADKVPLNTECLWVKNISNKKKVIDQSIAFKEFLNNPSLCINNPYIKEMFDFYFESLGQKIANLDSLIKQAEENLSSQYNKLHSSPAPEGKQILQSNIEAIGGQLQKLRNDKLKLEAQKNALVEFQADPSKPMPKQIRDELENVIKLISDKLEIYSDTELRRLSAEYKLIIKSPCLGNIIRTEAIFKRIINFPRFDKVPAFNLTPLLPLEQSTGKAPYQPTVNADKHQVLFKIAFDDLGTQIGILGLECGDKSRDNVPIQGRNPQNNAWSDWLLDPISDKELEAAKEKGHEVAKKIMQYGLNILIFRAFTGQSKGNKAPANVGKTTGGKANDQGYCDSTNTAPFMYAENSAVFLRITPIACQKIPKGEGANILPEILKLADDVADANEEYLNVLA